MKKLLAALFALSLGCAHAQQATIANQPLFSTFTPGYIASNWYIPIGPLGIVSPSGNAGVNTIKCFYGNVPRKLTIGALGAKVTSGATGNVQLAIYSNVNGRPGVLLSSTSSISTASATAISGSLSANKQVGPGGADNDDNVWWCSNIDNATAALVSTTIANFTGVASTLGSSALTNVTSAAALISGISCSGAACNGGSSTFGTWPTLTGSTWTDVVATTITVIAFQPASVP